MEAGKKTLTVEPGEWCEETRALIAQALIDCDVADIEEQTDCCAAQLFKLVQGGEMVAAFVLRIDRIGGRDEGVVVAAAGRVAGVDLTAVMMPFIEGMFHGCKSVRVHTARTGLGKKLVAMGYRVSEIIFRKEI